MKSPIISLSIISILLFLAFGFTACSSSSEPTLNSSDALSKYDPEVQTVWGDISDEEEAGLIFMREEEKLARDVYLTFHSQFGLRVFDNISKAEQVHMNAIKVLLDRYEIEDPVGENGIGVFVNEDLQNLYDALIEQGNVSAEAALEVGGIIEEVDILDLKEYLTGVDGNWDIARVYTNLERGSENHLRAYVWNLKRLGVIYEPHYLDQQTYDDIINR
ncbi:MAG: DUF2202 domain-containing protein [Chlorobi bacterium]|nr:DUF2202 domain-containing protein [Chlorobiota bacterium]